ncbi:MAG: Rieske 2Fe-2S domain-containing protein [Acidimicrobiales bacterium]|nr:Rieske 2Fe-2S domain-containing protein [Acidimicrobiales bacterium]
MASTFPHPLPVGWFALAYSDELKTDEVQTVTALNSELVLFRDADGAPRVLDAYCAHLGAHLGVGGEVDEGCITCPFHAWKYDGTGQCVEVPYGHTPPNAAVPSWPTCERNGLIMAWHDPDGGAPTWDVPEIPEATSPEWSDPQRFEWTVRTHPQEIAENVADSAHFRYVHGTKNVPSTEAVFEGPFRHSRNPVNLDTPKGPVDGEVVSSAFGLGLVTVRYKGICETLQVGSVTPIDDETVVIRKSFTQERVDGKNPEGGVAAAILRNVVSQLEQDIPIWEAKIYRDKPMLTSGDGPIMPYRRWARQFYPGDD